MNRIVAHYDLDRSMQSLNGVKVLVGGCFDMLHVGHLRFLQAAKKQGDVLIVALESDEFIQRKKNRVAVYPQAERAEILAAIESVDVVITLPFLASYEAYLQLVKSVKPHVIAATADDPLILHKEKQAREVNGKVTVVIDRIEPYATKSIARKLHEMVR